MEHPETYQYELIKKLAFIRYGGTEDEAKAAAILQGEIASFGGESELMEFEIPAWNITRCHAEVTAPFQREIPCVAQGRSGQLPEGGAELKLRYVEYNSPAGFYGLDDLSDSAVLVNPPLDKDLYGELVARKAAAILVIAMDKWYEEKPLPFRALRDHLGDQGKIPTFTLRSQDAMALVRDGAETARLELRQEEMPHTSRDVLAVIPGTEIQDECVVLTGHFDSVHEGPGTWDNASGAATLMYIYNHFLHNPPRRTMRFIWCGSEEQGLFGSKAYVAQHPDLLPSIRMCFNFDMCGTILGRDEIFVTGSDELKTLTQAICDQAGRPAELHIGVHSSDSAPFADKGIPAVGLSRGTRTGEIHTSNDRIDILSPQALHGNGEFFCEFIHHFVDAKVFPVKREMPENMVEELDKYFKRDTKKK